MKVKNSQSQKGFTLLEAMVAISIFTVVMVLGISALLTVSNTHKKTQNLRSIVDSVSYMMEDISRNMRLGSLYHCFTASSIQMADLDMLSNTITDPADCPSPGGGAYPWAGYAAVGFEGQDGDLYDSVGAPNDYSNLDDQIVYLLSARGGDATNCELQKSVEGGQQTTFVSVTPPEVHLSCSDSGFNVYDTGSSTSLFVAPRTLIRLSGTIYYKNTITPFNIQTTVSQRAVTGSL